MSKPRFTLEELLEKMPTALPRSDEDQAWLDLKPVGREILPDEEESSDTCDPRGNPGSRWEGPS